MFWLWWIVVPTVPAPVQVFGLLCYEVSHTEMKALGFGLRFFSEDFITLRIIPLSAWWIFSLEGWEKNHLTIELQLLRYSPSLSWDWEGTRERKSQFFLFCFLGSHESSHALSSGPNQGPQIRIRSCLSTLMYWLAEFQPDCVLSSSLSPELLLPGCTSC